MASYSDGLNAFEPVLFDEKPFVRTVILNRPQKLNCLTSEMISLMLDKFIAYEKDPKVSLVILKGNGKGFCAGGDVAHVINSIIASSWRFGARFYENQFMLDFILATYEKPLVCIMHGVVMGGGAGISMYATFRIVTEKTVFAMPETAIGLIPDVGASHFLARLPGYFGEYVGLTGARLDGAEMLACGLATHFVFSKDLPLLEKELQVMTSPSAATINDLINKFSHAVELGQNTSFRRHIIDKCFSKKTVEEILDSLQNQILENKSEKWIFEAVKSLHYASPTGLKVFLKSIRQGRNENLAQCYVREHAIVSHIMRKTFSHDFFEGSRALLFDKDKNPKWEPSRLELVTDETVKKFFNTIEDGNWNSLQLPRRPNFTGRILTPKL